MQLGGPGCGIIIGADLEIATRPHHHKVDNARVIASRQFLNNRIERGRIDKDAPISAFGIGPCAAGCRPGAPIGIGIGGYLPRGLGIVGANRGHPGVMGAHEKLAVGHINRRPGKPADPRKAGRVRFPNIVQRSSRNACRKVAGVFGIPVYIIGRGPHLRIDVRVEGDWEGCGINPGLREAYRNQAGAALPAQGQ